jgi:hypothetical protein
MSVSRFIETQLDLNPVNDLINTKIKWQNNVTIYGTVLALMVMFIMVMMMAGFGPQMVNQRMIACVYMLMLLR